MPACGSYLERALDVLLPFDLAEICIHADFIIWSILNRGSGLDEFFTYQVVHEFTQGIDWITSISGSE